MEAVCWAAGNGKEHKHLWMLYFICSIKAKAVCCVWFKANKPASAHGALTCGLQICPSPTEIICHGMLSREKPQTSSASGEEGVVLGKFPW